MKEIEEERKSSCQEEYISHLLHDLIALPLSLTAPRPVLRSTVFPFLSEV